MGVKHLVWIDDIGVNRFWNKYPMVHLEDVYRIVLNDTEIVLLILTEAMF